MKRLCVDSASSMPCRACAVRLAYCAAGAVRDHRRRRRLHIVELHHGRRLHGFSRSRCASPSVRSWSPTRALAPWRHQRAATTGRRPADRPAASRTTADSRPLGDPAFVGVCWRPRAGSGWRLAQHGRDRSDRCRSAPPGAGRCARAAGGDSRDPAHHFASPADAPPVFDTIAAAALKLCGARSVNMFAYDGELLHIAALAIMMPRASTPFAASFRGRPAATPRLPCGADPQPRGRPRRAGRPRLRDPPARGDGGIWRRARGAPAARWPADRRHRGRRAEPGPFAASQIALLQTFAERR